MVANTGGAKAPAVNDKASGETVGAV
jgi:hypothetical protein